jgi:PAS domain S-box-containing protein
MDILTVTKNSAESDQAYKHLLDSVPALVSCISTDLRYTYANDAFVEFVKLPREAIIGESVQKVLGDRIYKAIEKYMLKALHGEDVSFETTIFLPGGEVYFQATYIPAFNHDKVTGFASYVVKAAENTQELIRKNEDLKKSEERYHKMVEEVEDYAIILLDKEGNILDWNRGAEQIKGYKPNEIIGQNFRIFYLPQDRQKQLPETLLSEAIEKGKATHEGWRVKKDGTKFWGSIVITALHDSNEKIIGFSKVTRDLTERKAAEEEKERYALALEQKNAELKKSEERYHRMISEVEDYAIILLDSDGYVQNWNKGAEKIKGYKAEEIVGKSFSNFYLPEDQQKKLPF